jgi:hypothetical protein
MKRREPSEPGYDPTDDESDVVKHFKDALDEQGRKLDEEEKKGDGKIGWWNPKDEYGFASRGSASRSDASETSGQPDAFQVAGHRAPRGQQLSMGSRLFRALNRFLRRSA